MKNPLKSISPMAFVMAVACVLVVGSGLIRHFSKDTLEARVTIEDNGNAPKVRRATERAAYKSTFGDSDISTRYADRLRDASSLTLGLALHALYQRVSHKRVIPNVQAVLEEFAKTDLVPPQVTFIQPPPAADYGLALTTRGLYLIRYRARPLTIEVLACGARGLDDGAVFVVRLPESQPVPVGDGPPTEQAGGFATLFTAPLTNAIIPQPFSSAQTFAAAGWVQEPLRAAPITAQQLADLHAWLNAYHAENN